LSSKPDSVVDALNTLLLKTLLLCASRVNIPLALHTDVATRLSSDLRCCLVGLPPR
jgi:hypothetical protein